VNVIKGNEGRKEDIKNREKNIETDKWPHRTYPYNDSSLRGSKMNPGAPA
jgi:hypothetical protein